MRCVLNPKPQLYSPQTDPTFTLPEGMKKHLEEYGSTVAVTFSTYDTNLYSWAEPNLDKYVLSALAYSYCVGAAVY